MKLSELAQVTRGITTTKADLSPSAGKPYRVAQIRHMQDGKLLPPKELKAVFISPDRAPARFALKNGDILVAMLGMNPKVVAVKAAPRGVLADKEIAIVRPANARAHGRIAKYLSSDAGQDVLRSLRSGAAIMHMKSADLAALEIP